MAQSLHKAFNRLHGCKLNQRIKNPIPRCKELQALHGKDFLEVTFNANKLPAWFNILLSNSHGISWDGQFITKSNGQKISPTKWLTNMGISPEPISDIGRCLSPDTYKLTLSCSFKDLIRASDCDNWRSCWNTAYTHELLNKPNVAIAHHRTKHGSFDCRWIIFWIPELDGFVLHPYCYPQKKLPNKITNLCGVNIYTSHNSYTVDTNSINRLDLIDKHTRLDYLYDEFQEHQYFNIRKIE